MNLRKPAPSIGPSVRTAGSLDAKAVVGNTRAARRRTALIRVANTKGLPAASAISAALMLKNCRDLQVELRTDIEEVREALTEDVWPVEVTVTGNDGGEVQVVLTSADEAKDLLRALEARLESMSDMSQLLQMQLQDAVNKQSQAMQTLSSMMKNQHDTLKSIINNMR